MSASDFHFSLMNNVESLQTSPNKRKAFYIISQNLTDKFIPQVKVRLSGPPEVKLLIKTEIYGGLSNRSSKKRVFKVISKNKGIYTLIATLTTSKGHNIELPITLRVGTVQSVAKPVSLPIKDNAENLMDKVNCPFCGDQIDEESKFCPHCGSNVVNVKEKSANAKEEVKIKHCQNCGMELSKEAKFCAKCGQKIA